MIYEVHQWVASVANQCSPPYLEVGSRKVQDWVELRDLFPGPYVGLDMQDGPGVDMMADFEQGGVRAESFNTVICVDTLEHTPHPQRIIKNMHAVLAPGGKCVVGVPFAWYLHDHPRDYWRISPDALEDMLNGVGFMEVVAGLGGTELMMEWKPPFGGKPHRGSVWSHTLAMARK